MFNNSYEFVGVGYVIRDMSPGDWDCHVVILDSLSRGGGVDVASGLKEVVKVFDIASDDYTEVDMKSKPSLRCMWMAINAGSRITAPTLGKGARVFVYKKKGENKYYWEQFGIKPHTTKREQIIYLFPAFKETPGLDELSNTDSRKNPLTTLDYWNASYMLQIDTLRQYVGFRTTKVAGEACAFDFNFDLKYGNFQLIDDNGDGFEIMGKIRRLRIRGMDTVCMRTNSSYYQTNGVHNEMIGSYMSSIKGAFVQKVVGDYCRQTKKDHLESKDVEWLVDNSIKMKVKGEFLYHTEGDVKFISNSGKIGLYTNGTLELMGIGGCIVYAPKFSVNGIVNAMALNLGGEAQEPPVLTPPEIERTKWDILEKVEEAIIEYNKVLKEKDDKKEKEETQEPQEVENPSSESSEEPEPNAVAKLKGEMNFNIEKKINFSSNGRFDVNAKGGLSLCGGPMGDDLLMLIGSLIAEVGNICKNMLIPNNVIGVTPMGGPLVAGCAPAVMEDLTNIMKLLTKLNVIAGSKSYSVEVRNMARQTINNLECLVDKAKETSKGNSIVKTGYEPNTLNIDIEDL